MPLTYFINDADVIHSTIEDEVVMINLSNGKYYCLNYFGGWVWSMLQEQCSAAAIGTVIAEQVGLPVPQVQADVRALIAHLLEEKLILEHDAIADVSPSPLPDISKTPYIPPELTVFADMQELLLLDPIHETGTLGWPHADVKKRKHN